MVQPQSSAPSPRTLSVGVLGAGTVGSQVIRLLTEQAEDFAARSGAQLVVTGVAVRDLSAPREASVPRELLTDDATAVATSNDLVIELIGGIEPARTLILAAFKAGASVITGNKALIAAHGPELYARDPGRCCALRKVEPLARALSGYEAWATGVRREDAPTRSATPLVSFDTTHRIVKINPLAAWTFDDLLGYATRHDVIINPLLADGYPSIGCRPCTRRVAPGQDPRSGRWAGFAKTECGIHL